MSEAPRDARRTPALVARRAGEILRAEGPHGLLFTVLAELGYRRLAVLERRLEEPIPDLVADVALRFDRLAPDELDAYLAFHHENTRAQLEGRFRAGEECFVARHEDRLVCANWAAYRAHHIRYVDCAIPVAEGEVYLYDSYTDPGFRGLGIAPALAVELLRRFRAAGLRRATTAIVPENRANLSARAKSGFRVCGIIRRVGVGRWRRHFVRTER